MKSSSIVPLLSACLIAACAASEPAEEATPKTAAQAPRPMPDADSPPITAPTHQPAVATENAPRGPELAAPASMTSTATSSATSSPAKTPDVIYVPTPQPVVDRMLEVAKVKKSDIVYDLGCGDGRIVVTAAKKYGTKAFGFDVDPERVAEARENVRKNGVEDLVTIEQKDIFTLDLSPASVVTLYLLPELNVRLIPQLEKLKPGSRVVSHDFDMAGVTPVKQLSLKPESEDRAHQVYLWTIPLKKSGASK
jgi:hypothetical protein